MASRTSFPPADRPTGGVPFTPPPAKKAVTPPLPSEDSAISPSMIPLAAGAVAKIQTAVLGTPAFHLPSVAAASSPSPLVLGHAIGRFGPEEEQISLQQLKKSGRSPSD